VSRGSVGYSAFAACVYDIIIGQRGAVIYRGERRRREKKNKWFYVSYIHTSMMTLVKKG